MKRSVLLLSLALACPAAAQKPSSTSTSRPSTQETALDQEREKNRRASEEKFANLQSIQARPINEIFQLGLDQDQLILIPKMASTDNSPRRIEVTDFPGLASVTIGTDKDGSNQINSVQMQHESFSGPGIILKITQLLAPPTSLQIAQGVEAETYGLNISLMRQQEDPSDPNSKPVTRLYVQKFAPNDGDLVAQLSLKAPSFVELRRRYPRETQAYLVPILRDLKQMQVLAVDPLLAQQVLGAKSKAGEELIKKVNAVLAKFDSDQFQARESAAKELQSLGGEAALYLRNADRSGWSQEQINGVEAFLASFSTIPHEEAKKLAASPAFLLDVLYSEDVNLREAAIEQLKKVAEGKPIEFDQDAPKKSGMTRSIASAAS